MYVFIHLHTFIHTNSHTYIHGYIHTFIHTCTNHTQMYNTHTYTYVTIPEICPSLLSIHLICQGDDIDNASVEAAGNEQYDKVQ